MPEFDEVAKQMKAIDTTLHRIELCINTLIKELEKEHQIATASRNHIVAEQAATRRDGIKIIMALIGLSAAVIGVKIVGSPIMTDIFVFVTCVAIVFLSGTLVWRWKHIAWAWRISLMAFLLLMLWSVGNRMFGYEVGVQPAPLYFRLGVDAIFTIVAMCLIVGIWWTDNHQAKVKANLRKCENDTIPAELMKDNYSVPLLSEAVKQNSARLDKIEAQLNQGKCNG